MCGDGVGHKVIIDNGAKILIIERRDGCLFCN